MCKFIIFLFDLFRSSSDENLGDAKLTVAAASHNMSEGPEGDMEVCGPENVTITNGSEGHKSGKKRRREKHRSRYSPELGSSGKEHKRKRKKKSIDIDEIPHPRITIKVSFYENWFVQVSKITISD